MVIRYLPVRVNGYPAEGLKRTVDRHGPMSSTSPSPLTTLVCSRWGAFQSPQGFQYERLVVRPVLLSALITPHSLKPPILVVSISATLNSLAFGYPSSPCSSNWPSSRSFPLNC